MIMNSLLLLAVACCLLGIVHARHTLYQVLIDSGSTGSRVYVYRHFTGAPMTSLFEVAHMRVRPALSTFFNDKEGLTSQLQTMIRFAEDHVSPKFHGSTAISLKATAGLRVLSAAEQDWLIGTCRQVLATSNFSFNPLETRVLSGSEEALYALLATNLAFSNASAAAPFDLALGAADWGGSSKQIAFALPPRTVTLASLSKLTWSSLWHLVVSYPAACEPDYRLRLPGSGTAVVEVFARSVPGLGIVSAQQEARSALAARHWDSFDATSSGVLGGVCPLSGLCPALPWYSHRPRPLSPGPLVNPCAPPGAPISYEQQHAALPWEGSGDFAACAALIKEVLLPSAHREAACMAALPVRTIIAMDNFPKVLEVMGLRGDTGVSPRALQAAGEAVCRTPWTELQERFPSFPAYRLQQACFGAAFVYAVATEVYRVAEDDALSFVPTDEHRHFSVGWPLGAALYYASNLTYDNAPSMSAERYIAY